MSKAKKYTHPVVWIRRVVQLLIFILFMYLLLETTYHPINEVGGPVTFFFEIDPLVMVSTFLAEHTVPAILLLSLITLGITFIFGRWFCGWFCPFGAVHNFFTSLFKGKRKQQIDHHKHYSSQGYKYYGLIVFLLLAVSGLNLVGWLDPFSFFFRAMSTSIMPAFNAGTNALFTWLYETDPGIGPLRVTAVSEPVYTFLRDNILDVEQTYFHWGMLIGVLFIGVILLNLVFARFWCRFICPLGAMLGVTGKNPLVRVHRQDDLCNECGLCVAHCQGGANPDKKDGWKPAECFYCWNCQSDCPHEALNIGFRRSSKGGQS